MTALRTMLTGMATNSMKCVSSGGVSGDPFSPNTLPRTMVNFDGLATDGTGTWTGDTTGAAPVATGGPGGIGVNTVTSHWSFCAGAVDPDTGNCGFFGGGHTDNGDGSVYFFDIQTAASSINLGTGGGIWAVKIKSCRYLDAFSQSKPAWSKQPAPTAPSARNQAYYATTNADGIQMPIVCHSYASLMFIPGSGGRAVGGGIFMFDAIGEGYPGAPFFFDFTNATATYPLSPSFPSGFTGHNGFAGSGGGDTGNVAMVCPVYNDQDGFVYTFEINAFHQLSLGHYSNYFSSGSIALTSDSYAVNHLFSGGIDIACLPTPGATAQRTFFQHGEGVNLDTGFTVLQGLNGGTLSDSYNTYSSGVTTADGAFHCSQDYDPTRGVIWVCDGATLFKVTPSATLTAWTMAAVASITGDTLSKPTTGSNLPRIKYVAAHDCLVIVNLGVVTVYKPSGWNPPADVVPAQPYQPWYQLGPFLAQ